MGIIGAIASILMIIGALNWGLVGLFKFNLISYLFKGDDNLIARILYILVGLSGLYVLLYSIFS